METLPTFSREQLEQFDKATLIEIILSLQTGLAQLTARVQQLEDRVAKNSSNSGKPPSSDGLAKKPAPKSLRASGQRKSGGQKGHKGETLEMVDEPDHLEIHSVQECPHCQTDLSAVAVYEVEKRQVFDLPPVRVEVTEHQSELKCCPGCGQAVRGEFPAEVRHPVQYGNRILAYMVYLNVYQLLPMRRVVELLGDFYGQMPSQALIESANQRLAAQIAPTLTAIGEQLQAAPVVHCDETGIRVAGKLNWLHVVCTRFLTAYGVHAKRGYEALLDLGILSTFSGRTVHDGWASYFKLAHCRHALCNAHHLRELLFVFERTQQTWPQQMTQLLLDIYHEVQTTRDLAPQLTPERRRHYEARYDEVLRQGLAANPPPEEALPKKRGRKKQSDAVNLLSRLSQYRAETLAFMTDFRVPFDNNLAEQALRMMKVKQKISGAFRTLAGAQVFCDIRGYLSTARKHGLNMIRVIFDAFAGNPFIPVPQIPT